MRIGDLVQYCGCYYYLVIGITPIKEFNADIISFSDALRIFKKDYDIDVSYNFVTLQMKDIKDIRNSIQYGNLYLIDRYKKQYCRVVKHISLSDYEVDLVKLKLMGKLPELMTIDDGIKTERDIAKKALREYCKHIAETEIGTEYRDNNKQKYLYLGVDTSGGIGLQEEKTGSIVVIFYDAFSYAYTRTGKIRKVKNTYSFYCIKDLLSMLDIRL